MEPINSFFPHLNVQLFQQYLKKKGLNNLAFNFFYCHKKAYRKWASFIIFLYMHRNMLSTRLENQEGRDRLKCLAIYVHQKTSSDKSMKDGVQNTWFTGTWIPRTEGMKRTMTFTTRNTEASSHQYNS